MTKFLQLVISGAANGAIYGALAVSICLVFRVSGVLNTAVGAIAVLPAILASHLQAEYEINRVMAILVTLVATLVLAYAADRLVTAPALNREASLSEAILVMFGLALILEGTGLLYFGREPFVSQAMWSGSPFTVAGARIFRQQMLLVLAAVVLAAGLTAFFRLSLTGKAMTACLDNPRGCSIVGIPVARLRRLAFMAAALIAAVIGHLVMPIFAFSFDSGFQLTLTGLLAASMVGLSDPLKGLVAGVGIGLLESMTAGYVTSTFQTTLVFAALAVVLLTRPNLVAGRAVH